MSSDQIDHWGNALCDAIERRNGVDFDAAIMSVPDSVNDAERIDWYLDDALTFAINTEWYDAAWRMVNVLGAGRCVETTYPSLYAAISKGQAPLIMALLDRNPDAMAVIPDGTRHPVLHAMAQPSCSTAVVCAIAEHCKQLDALDLEGAASPRIRTRFEVLDAVKALQERQQRRHREFVTACLGADVVRVQDLMPVVDLHYRDELPLRSAAAALRFPGAEQRAVLIIELLAAAGANLQHPEVQWWTDSRMDDLCVEPKVEAPCPL
jgi:hypothetical protein